MRAINEKNNNNESKAGRGLIYLLRSNWDRLLLLLVMIVICFSGQILQAAFSFNIVAPRQDHTATLLQDGQVLIAGGFSNGSTATPSAELYNPGTGQSTLLSPPSGALVNVGGLGVAGHSATALPNGKILIAGGKSKVSSLPVAEAQLYDPNSKSFTPTGSMNYARYEHTATLLADGRVLITGGGNPSLGGALVYAELYDPNTGLFSNTGNLGTARARHAAARLKDGRVLITGGFSTGSAVNTAELYNPATGTFVATFNNMTAARAGHTATVLTDGRVVIAAGFSGSAPPNDLAINLEIFDPAGGGGSGSFGSDIILPTKRAMHSATLLTNGRVMLSGGVQSSSSPFFGTPTATNEIFNPALNNFSTAGPLTTAVQSHTATLLPSGKVLIAGGSPMPQASNYSQVSTANLIDLRTPSVTSAAAMSTSRFDFAATTLPDSTILIAGGAVYTNITTGAKAPLNSAELFDPATGLYTTVGPMNVSRHGLTATLLKNGKVLLAGGFDGTAESASAELYDLVARTFTPTAGSMSSGRYYHTATLLPNGKVLLAGGQTAAGTSVSSAVLYDPGTDSFTDVATPMGFNRSNHTATLLKNGKVLLAGGYSIPGSSSRFETELFDPTTAVFSTITTMNYTRARHTATTLPDGRVLLVGGDGSGTTTVDIFNPQNNTYDLAGGMSVSRAGHTATLLQSGRVLLVGGIISGPALNSMEFYDPETTAAPFSNAPQMNSGRGNFASALLPDGRVLLLGGEINNVTFSYGATSSAEIFDPGLGFSIAPVDPRPAITAVNSVTPGPPRLNLTGSGFTGVGEGSSGVSSSSSTAIPLLQVQKLDNGLTSFAPSDLISSWSATSFTTGDLASFIGGSGYYRLALFANAIPSAAQIIKIGPQLVTTASSFPASVVGATSAAQSVTLNNSGNLPLTLQSATVAGAEFSPIAGGSCGTLPTTLLPGVSCTLNHTFRAAATGSRSASMTILSDAMDTPSHVVTLTGTGIQGGDVNGDGKVDLADALLALQMVVGLATPTPSQLVIADVAPLSGGVPAPDGLLNSGDAIVILRRAAGITSW